MSLGSLITALKVVPWSDVIAAAPAIAKGARKVFTRAESAPEPVVPEGAPVDERLRLLETRLQEMASREQAQARIVEQLAEQNAALVSALNVMRVRAWWVIGVNAFVVTVLIGALVLSYLRFGSG